MIIIDVIIGIFLVLAIWSGWKKGFVYQIVSLISVLVGIFVASRFWHVTFDFLHTKLDWDPNILKYVSMILTAVLVILAVIFIGKLISKLIEVTIFGVFDKILGALLSLLEMIIVVSFLIYGINYFFPKNDFVSKEKIQESYTLPYIEPIAETIAEWVGSKKSIIDDFDDSEPEKDEKNIFTKA